MGLDISVYKVVNEPTDEYYTLSEHPELSRFPTSDKEVDYYDIEEKEGYEWYRSSFNEDVVFEYINDEGDIYEVKNPPTKTVLEKVVYVVEVGYQRKGANKLFYEDDMWNSPAVTNKEELLAIWDKYFSGSTPRSKGGWGSSVEYDLSDEDMRTRFKENIIDKFEQGETFVMFH